MVQALISVIFLQSSPRTLSPLAFTTRCTLGLGSCQVTLLCGPELLASVCLGEGSERNQTQCSTSKSHIWFPGLGRMWVHNRSRLSWQQRPLCPQTEICNRLWQMFSLTKWWFYRSKFVPTISEENLQVEPLRPMLLVKFLHESLMPWEPGVTYCFHNM